MPRSAVCLSRRSIVQSLSHPLGTLSDWIAIFGISSIVSSDRRNDFKLRGNQRDRDRERAQARAGGKPKNPKTDGLTPEQRRERDAKALQEKLAKKACKDSSGAINGSNGIKTKK
ncbi:unnamed protein product [Lactuca saligna]|uniref:Small EDRK-rich factor-like N-terminal domain-containing protein n=1 Tax=Lactuca saligna TaxID=75948 RepID=A0AA35V241_LACSI|nr:unnamed protein product [Lactuca saligna]